MKRPTAGSPAPADTTKLNASARRRQNARWKRAALAACVVGTLAGTGCRSGMPSWNMFGMQKAPSPETLAGSGPSTTYPVPPSATATPEAIASAAGGTKAPGGVAPITGAVAGTPAAATPSAGPAPSAAGVPAYAAAANGYGGAQVQPPTSPYAGLPVGQPSSGQAAAGQSIYGVAALPDNKTGNGPSAAPSTAPSSGVAAAPASSPYASPYAAAPPAAANAAGQTVSTTPGSTASGKPSAYTFPSPGQSVAASSEPDALESDNEIARSNSASGFTMPDMPVSPAADATANVAAKKNSPAMSAITLPGEASRPSGPAPGAGTPAASVATKPSNAASSEKTSPTDSQNSDSGVVANLQDTAEPAMPGKGGTQATGYGTGPSVSPNGYQPGSTGRTGGYPGAGKGIIR